MRPFARGSKTEPRAERNRANCNVSKILPPNHQGQRNLGRVFSIVCAETRVFSRAAKTHNSNVSKILPVTTLRTIDLGGKKNSDPLFSRFCAKTESFFGLFSAPKSVHPIGARRMEYRLRLRCDA